MKFLKPAVILSLACLLISGTIDLNQLFNYADQEVPEYIRKDNTGDNAITDIGATLGRVLFYDKHLSANNTIACASCHLQEHAFGDPAERSTGLNGGLTGRHAMRLVNARFANETQFFWDERAEVLEDQTTMPIQDHVEMGFSGVDGDPGMDELIARLGELEYYPTLFELAFGDPEISEERISRALAQFVRSIQSFDSKFDAGLALVNNLNVPFHNFTPEENAGKALFVNPPQLGGAGCQGCHRAPEFDIDPDALNNGVIGVAGYPDSTDLTNTRAPSLRDLFKPDGTENGPFMHDASMTTLLDVINHYDHITFNPQTNPQLDLRLRGAPPGMGQNLNLTEAEKQQLIAFLKTLSGEQIYSEEAYSNPFAEDGSIEIIGLSTATQDVDETEIQLYPNPVISVLTITGPATGFDIVITDMQGRRMAVDHGEYRVDLNLSALPAGVYLATISGSDGKHLKTSQLVKVE